MDQLLLTLVSGGTLLLALLFLVFMLWNSAKVRMSYVAVNWVRYGLLLWIAGGTFDLMDEIFVQPKWMGYYCEDLLRLSGMLLVPDAPTAPQ